jgi:hypothetical protein
MSDKVKLVTPREIAEMLINEEAYQSTLFVTAADHDAEIARLRTRVSELESVLMLLCDRNYGLPSPLQIGEWSKAICAAKLLLEAKP